MKSHEYWQKRAAQIAARQFQSAEDYAKELRKEYDKAIVTIQRDMEVFYHRFADENGIVDMAEARKILNAGQLKEFRMTLEEFTEKAKDNADGRWTQQLNNAYYRTRISRFEALLTEIRHQVEMLSASYHKGIERHLTESFTDTYYRTIFEIEKASGKERSFAQIDKAKMEKVLKTDFAGDNWSNRVWADRDRLTREIHTKLSQSFIRGDSIDRTTQDIAQAMNASYKRSYRLVHTESTFFSGQAAMEGYNETGVERYEFMAAWNERTCPTCGALDGKVFKVSEQEPGVNVEPIHPHCHCTTVPWFEDEFNEETGEIEDTKPGKTYEDWKRERIDEIGQDQWNLQQKMIKNEAADREQYERYKDVLGKDVPKPFEKFQNLKYNEMEKWSKLKTDYRKLNAYNKVIANEPAITADLKAVSNSADMDLVGLEYRIKSRDSYLRKVGMDSDYSVDSKVIHETVSSTNDVIRYTYQASHDSLVDKYLEVNQRLAEKGYKQEKMKNTWPIKANPYKGINCTYSSPTGQKFEIQYHTPESFELKNGEMHQLYEQWRLIKDKASSEAVELSKKMSELSSKLKYPEKITELR